MVLSEVLAPDLTSRDGIVSSSPERDRAEEFHARYVKMRDALAS